MSAINCDTEVIKCNRKPKIYSAAGPDGIQAIFLINTREYIKAPLALVLKGQFTGQKLIFLLFS